MKVLKRATQPIRTGKTTSKNRERRTSIGQNLIKTSKTNVRLKAKLEIGLYTEF